MHMEWDGKQESNLIYEQHVGDTFTRSDGRTIKNFVILLKFQLEVFVVAPTYCSQMFTGRVCARPL